MSHRDDTDWEWGHYAHPGEEFSMKLKDKLLYGLLFPFIPATIMGFMGYGWYYLLTWFFFYIAFGIFGEWLSVKTRGKTVSNDISDTPTWLFVLIVISWIVFPLILIVHWWMGRG